MQPFFFRLKALVIATAAGLALAACGGGGGDGPAFYPAAPAATAEPTLAPALPESVGFSSDRLKMVIEKAHAIVDSKVAAPPGIAVYVARHGKIVLDDVYGASDLASGAPLRADAIYRIYSQTKPVTAVAMLIVLGMIHVLGSPVSLATLSPSIYDALTDPSK
jgi:CubicO group peptidase (beta-lactamase class C family)